MYKTSLVFYFIIQLLGFGWLINFYENNLYLPSPFLWHKGDTFMDFFNTSYWGQISAEGPGAYEIWRSIYPPFNFILTNQLTDIICGDCNWLSGPTKVRDTEYGILGAMILIYIMAPLISINIGAWRRLCVSIKLFFYISFIISYPFLYALERGNLIILLLPIVSCLEFLKGSLWWGLFFAASVNVKPYMVIASIVPIAQKNISKIIYSLLISIIVFFVSGEAMNDDYLLIFDNIASFSSAGEGVHSNKEILGLPTSIDAFSYVLDPEHLPTQAEIPLSREASAVISAARVAIMILAIIASCINKRGLHQASLLIVAVSIISNSGISVGGYSIILYFPLIPEFLRLRTRKLCMVLLAILFLPLDFFVIYESSMDSQKVFLSGLNIYPNWQLTLGALIRPIINFLLLMTLVSELMINSMRRKCCKQI